MREVVINDKKVKIKNQAIKIRCPKCGKVISHNFLYKAVAQLGKIKQIERNHDYYVELGLKAMAKRWNKPVDRLRKRYQKRLKKSEG